MLFTLSTVTLALASLISASVVKRQNCPEAARFGVVHVTPTTVSAGDIINVNVDLRCAVQLGVVAQSIDYTIDVPVDNNGFEFPILIGRHIIQPGALFDNLTTIIPHANFFAGANYVIEVTNVHPSNDAFITEGSVDTGITINV
ncbi:hypothetical protein D9613_011222 [Agrocybe pediades]|uniref:Uncharacterized protein n=1 Tax=Agrocybe pediades TaxID=84607 RepID=A0A8H4QRN0_9AGAR|nr:hypothetical protein D9613_011222 [Agrocybe pediades]